MPHHKGRARDVVPHREHRTSKKADANRLESPALGPVPSRTVVAFDLDGCAGNLPFPSDLWSRTMPYLGFADICKCEMTARGAWICLAKENELWQLLCSRHFPSMWQSVVDNPSKCSFLLSPSLQKAELSEAPIASIDWKLLFARRLQKQLRWDQGHVRANSRCVACGEALSAEPGASDECAVHMGDFLPLNSAVWSRAELQQLQSYAMAAWRSIGGTSALRRSARMYRGGGHWAKGLSFKGWGSQGHWAEGLGKRPGSLNLRACILGHVPCAWSCCGSDELISEGCQVAVHRAR